VNLAPHYEVLGLPPGSPLASVKRAYLREIKTWHPDRYSPNSLLREQAEERTKALTAAYAALSKALKEPGPKEGHSPGAWDDGRGAAPARRAEPAPGTGSDDDGEEWLGRVWRHLKARWRRRPATPRREPRSRPKAARRPGGVHQPPGKRGAARKSPGRRVTPPFEAILHSTPTPPGGTADSPLARRRLAARRAHYRRQRSNRGPGPIEASGPIRPVAPVRRIRPVGEDD
jgi:curved DNA-binding protein CbpA